MRIIDDIMTLTLDDVHRAMFRPECFFFYSSNCSLSLSKYDILLTDLRSAMHPGERCDTFRFYPERNGFTVPVIPAVTKAAEILQAPVLVLWRGLAGKNKQCIKALADVCGDSRFSFQKHGGRFVYSPFHVSKKQNFNHITLLKVVKMINSGQIKTAQWRGRRSYNGISDAHDFAKRIYECGASGFRICEILCDKIVCVTVDGVLLDLFLEETGK